MTIAPPDNQLSLLYVTPRFTITNNAQARNAYGIMAQELVCAALGLTPIRINGNFDVCFDAAKDNTYYEIKSCRRGCKIVIYDWRMQKEQEVNKSNEVFYAILVHQVSRSSGEELLTNFIKSELELLLVQTSLIHQLALQEPLRTLMKPQSKRTGYNRKGYVDGYRNLPLSRIKPLLTRLTILPVCFDDNHFQVKLYAH
jgi:hypothetical protein